MYSIIIVLLWSLTLNCQITVNSTSNGIWGPTAKLISCQYFWLYGISTCGQMIIFSSAVEPLYYSPSFELVGTSIGIDMDSHWQSLDQPDGMHNYTW